MTKLWEFLLALLIGAVAGAAAGSGCTSAMYKAEGAVLAVVPDRGEVCDDVAYRGGPELRAALVSESGGLHWYIIPNGYPLPVCGTWYDESEAKRSE